MTKNHLIIGLGGTGGKVLAAYRKLIFEKFKGNMNPEGLWIDYIYVDSSEKDLNETGGIWNALGTSVALEKGSKVSIKAANLKQYIESIDNYPYLKPWIGSAAEWKNIINDPKVQDGAAGQKRRLGRFLFANRVDKFNETVNAKVRRLQQNPAGLEVTFHICCGLAGGTGSGSLIDAITQIKDTYNDNTNYKIILYLLLPEEIPNKAWATTDNYQPNGYAALLELNALDYLDFKPYNIGERKNEVKRLANPAPFYSAYIITEQNKENVKFEVDTVLPATIAEFLFQKTVAVKDDEAQNVVKDDAQKNSMLNRAETGENPDYGSYGYKHSFKFLTFGIKRLAIPEQEIKEYFTYNIAKQVALQVLFNNPSNEIGYQEEPLPNDDYSEVTKAENLNRWNLSLPHLCLSTPVLENHKSEGWKPINEEFSIKVDEFKQETLHKDAIAHDMKLLAISNMTKDFFEKKFRSLGQSGGVEEFFKTKRKVGLEEIARKILSDIESDFFNKWEKGNMSFFQMSTRLNALKLYLEDLIERLEKMTVDANSTVAACNVNLKNHNTEWTNIGIIGKSVFTTKKDSIANDFSNDVKKKYQMLTWIIAYAFAADIINEIKAGLIHLKGSIDDANTVFKKALVKFNEEVNSKCNDDVVQGSKQAIIIKHYDPKKVRDVSTKVIKRRSYLDNKVAQLRTDIVSMLGEGTKQFSKITKQIGVDGIISQLQNSSSKVVENLFEGTEGNEIPGFEKLIGENIIRKLKEEYGGNEAGLKNKLEELVKHAAVLARLNEAQTNDGPPIREYLLIILPDYKEDEEFLNKIKKIFAGIINNSQIETGGKPNEIVIVNIESNIGLRYLRSVETLRKTYDALTQSPVKGQVALFETHIESVETSNLSSLYKLTLKEKEEQQQRIQEESVPYLLIANSSGLLETSKNKLALIKRNKYGLVEATFTLGKNLEESVSNMNSESLNMLKDDVTQLLAKSYHDDEDKQDELIKEIVSTVNEIKKSYKNDESNPTVALFNDSANKSIEIIKSLNE